jgi:hypothetical protein
VATNFPSTIDTTTTLPTWDGSGTLAAPGGSNSALTHSGAHTNGDDSIRAVEAKVGQGSSTPTNVGDFLTVTAAGASAWQPQGIVQSTKVASYTLVLGDAGDMIEMNVASANVLNVPANSSVAFPIGTQVGVRQIGAGVTTVTPIGTATVVSRGSLVATAGQWAEAVLTKRAIDQWVLAGDIA